MHLEGKILPKNVKIDALHQNFLHLELRDTTQNKNKPCNID